MASMDITLGWMQLPEADQLHQWRSFLASLDVGDAGYHRWYGVLMPLWDRGDVPELILDEQFDRRDAELRAEALWEAEHGFGRDWAEQVLGPPPF
jgi:hypothetical protein